MPSAMPPRRRPGQAQPPARKPRVAGIRRTEPAADAEDRTEIIPAVPAEDPTPSPAERTTDERIDAGRTGAEPGAERAAERPRPTGKRRPRPTPAPTGADRRSAHRTTAEPDWAEYQPMTEVRGERSARRSLRVPVVLAVVAVLLGGAAAWFGVEWSHARSGGTNTALTDNATTAEVSGQVTSAVNTVFSYNYADLKKSQQAVHQVLTGLALCQYDSLFKEIQQQAPKQKLVLTATVVDKGVELLQGDTARVLMLVQQHDTRATTNQSSDAESVIAVNAVKQGDDWRISAFDTFTGDDPTTCKS